MVKNLMTFKSAYKQNSLLCLTSSETLFSTPLRKVKYLINKSTAACAVYKARSGYDLNQIASASIDGTVIANLNKLICFLRGLKLFSAHNILQFFVKEQKKHFNKEL